MSKLIKINKEAYQKLITEDIEWLLKETERSLERDHIIEVLESSVSKYCPEFPEDKMREKSDKYVDDLYEEEIEKCESPKNIKKATNDIKKLYQKLVEENKSDLSKLTDLVIVFQRKAQQHEGLDNGIYALVRVYNSLIDETADYVAEHIEEYNDKGIKQFESIS